MTKTLPGSVGPAHQLFPRPGVGRPSASARGRRFLPGISAPPAPAGGRCPPGAGPDGRYWSAAGVVSGREHTDGMRDISLASRRYGTTFSGPADAATYEPQPTHPAAMALHAAVTHPSSQCHHSFASPCSGSLRICGRSASGGTSRATIRYCSLLDEARHTEDPVHLIRLFGLAPATAMRYLHAAHPRSHTLPLALAP